MSFNWISSCINDSVPDNAVFAGNDSDGSKIYVGRADHAGNLLPAKVIPSKNECYVCYEGEEISKENYEVLCGSSLTWVGSSNGDVPNGAVQTGNTSSGEPLYAGRAHLQGSLTPGKIHRSHGCCYIPYGGEEHAVKDYEVLVSKKKPEWICTFKECFAPCDAIVAGHDIDETPIYVGRCDHEGNVLPCKAMPNKQVAYCCYDGIEYAKDNYDILCNGNISWVDSENGEVPSNAIPGGNTSCGETLYIGRVYHDGSLCVGKIHPFHNVCYIPFGGEEHAYKSYEVMVQN